MAFFNSAVGVLQTLVVALGAGLGIWGAMPIHGIAPYAEFRLTERSDTEMLFEMEDTPGTREQFPRTFRFRILYRLAKNTLYILYEVINTDSRTLYFGLGGHPGFRVPNAEGKSFEEYRLRFSAPADPKRIGFTADCFRDGTETPFPLKERAILPLKHSLFDDDAIVLKDTANEITLETEGDHHTITVRYPGMHYLGIWHAPHTDAPYLCIEPWCSLPSQKDETTVFEQRKDLISLQPHQWYRNEWSITFGEENRADDNP